MIDKEQLINLKTKLGDEALVLANSMAKIVDKTPIETQHQVKFILEEAESSEKALSMFCLLDKETFKYEQKRIKESYNYINKLFQSLKRINAT